MPGPVHELEFAAAPGSWRFWTAPPDADLAHAVAEYWEVRGDLSPFRERVLPNACVELMVNLGPRHFLHTQRGTSTWDHAWLSGLHEQALVIESPSGTHLVSARLHPLDARDLLGTVVPASANRVVDLREVFAEADGLRARLLEAGSPAARFELLERFLRERNIGRVTPEFVHEAVQRIDAAHGNLRVSALHAEVGVSRKHLAVSFAREVGISAKAYAQVRRFGWTVARLQEATSVDWSQLASEAGYSDQSHLVRDFQRVAAANPTDFLRRQTPDGSALLLDQTG